MKNVIIITALIIGLLLPIRWIIILWLEDKVLSHARGVAVLLSHLGIIGYLAWKEPLYGAIYGGTLAVTVTFIPMLGLQSETRKSMRQARVDIKHYRALLTRHPENAGAHSALADAYLECKQYDDAQAEYQIALKLDPENYRVEEYKLKQARQKQMLYEERRWKKQKKQEEEI